MKVYKNKIPNHIKRSFSKDPEQASTLEKTSSDLDIINEKMLTQQEKLKEAMDELQKYQQMLKRSEERLKLIADGASDDLWDWDITSNTAYIAERWKKAIGFEQQEICDYYKTYINLVHPVEVHKIVKSLNNHLNGKTPFYSCEYRLKLKDGKYAWVFSRGKALWDNDGKAIRIAGSHTDITERKKAENKLKRLAYYDPLTGAALRKVFMDKLKHSIINAKKKGLKIAVLFLDLDSFKIINDTYGHHIGDRFLKKIASRLKSCIRKTDILCRMGGDEFALLVPNLNDVNYVDEISNRIIGLFDQPICVSGHKIYSTISIGIAIYPNNGLNGKTLLKKADIALYKAKENGKGRLQYFNNYIGKVINLRSSIEYGLRTALENDEFFLCYQPLVNTKTGKTVCTEALIRWKHPVKGVINPVEFIPIAEESGLIVPIGEWVLKTACSQLKKWHNMGYSNFGLSVNVSAIQLQQVEFAETVNRILSENGLLPKHLELEITESAFIHSNYIAAKNLSCLKKKGVRISIDDFGTGYCCLEYLQKIAVNGLKIDRKFVSNIKVNVNKAIIDSVISLGHKINIDITAEGVETKEQYDYLGEKGCDKVQGFYFSKPLSATEATDFLKGNLLDIEPGGIERRKFIN